MNRVVRALMFAACVALLVLTGAALLHRERLMQLAHGLQERSDGREIADRLLSSRDVLDYIAEHPDEVSLASWTVGAESQGIYLNADRKCPVASVQALLVLAEYARRIEAGQWSPAEVVALAEWERYWLNGSDGGAHPAALHEARAEARVSRGSVRLRDIAAAMMRHGDNAAYDLLLDRISQPSAAELPQQLGLAADDPPLPLAGLFLTWQAPSQPAAELLARYRVFGPQRYTEEAWRLTERLRDDDKFRSQQAELSERVSRLSLREQAQLAAALGPQGTARGYARLMAQVASGELPGSQWMREQLEWPMASERARADFESLGSKRGSLPGAVAAAHYAVAKGAEAPRVLALFIKSLPPAVWLHMSRTIVQQRFELELLEDDGFFAQARERLMGSPSAPQAEHHASSR